MHILYYILYFINNIFLDFIFKYFILILFLFSTLCKDRFHRKTLLDASSFVLISSRPCWQMLK